MAQKMFDRPGRAVREARRALGITQQQLADRLGVRQASVSRWEAGREEIPPRRQLQLLDLFLNKRDAIHPVLERLVRRRGDVTINSDSWHFVRTSSMMQCAFELSASDMDGHHVEGFFAEQGTLASREVTWQETEFGPLLFNEVEGDVAFRKRGATLSLSRVWSRFFNLSFDGYPNLRISQLVRVAPANGQPTVTHGSLRLGEIGR